MTVSFHIGILPNQDVSNCVDLGLAAEKLGYAGIWVADSHSVMRDAYAVLAILASQTERIKLASGVTHTVTRHPAVLANAWSTLHEIFVKKSRAMLRPRQALFSRPYQRNTSPRISGTTWIGPSHNTIIPSMPATRQNTGCCLPTAYLMR